MNKQERWFLKCRLAFVLWMLLFILIAQAVNGDDFDAESFFEQARQTDEDVCKVDKGEVKEYPCRVFKWATTNYVVMYLPDTWYPFAIIRVVNETPSIVWTREPPELPKGALDGKKEV